MDNLIRWEKSKFSDEIYGYTNEDLECLYPETYKIKDNIIKCYHSNNGDYSKVGPIKCASIEDAKQLAEIVERGRVA